MSRVVELDKVRTNAAIRRGYRNWTGKFGEEFGDRTGARDLSETTLIFLAKASDEASFYLYDLIMNLLNLGSGFEIRELSAADRMIVMDRYLFVLDRLRFEIMRRLGWLEDFEGEEITLVELIKQYDRLAPRLQAAIPSLNPGHPEYEAYQGINTLEKESFIRKLIPDALERFEKGMGETS
jgi:hypothetical protein